MIRYHYCSYTGAMREWPSCYGYGCRYGSFRRMRTLVEPPVYNPTLCDTDLSKRRTCNPRPTNMALVREIPRGGRSHAPGRVTNAYMEMVNELAAPRMANCSSSCVLHLGGREVTVRFSSERQRQRQPGAVLRVRLLNDVFAVTADALHHVFSRYGEVLKIRTFERDRVFHAFIQYAEKAVAETAKRELNNTNMYKSCCTLSIASTSLTSVHLQPGDRNSRDYTITERGGVVVTRWLRNPEDPGSIQITVFSDLPKSLPANAGMVPLERARPISFPSFPGKNRSSSRQTNQPTNQHDTCRRCRHSRHAHFNGSFVE